MLLNHPIPVRNLEKPVNGRSSFIRLRSSDQVYAASLAMFAKKNSDNTERPPTLTEWQALLNTGNFAGPRDKTPTPPNATSGVLIYGRVAGISSGSQWQAKLVDNSQSPNLTIPQGGKAISYALDTLLSGRLGTQQIQTAKMLVRYPDTAYEAHSNYGVEFDTPRHKCAGILGSTRPLRLGSLRYLTQRWDSPQALTFRVPLGSCISASPVLLKQIVSKF